MAALICTRCSAPSVRKYGMCAPCWAEYMREHRKREKRSVEHRHFVRGVEAMRAAAVKLMREVGVSEMNGYTAAVIIQDVEISCH